MVEERAGRERREGGAGKWEGEKEEEASAEVETVELEEYTLDRDQLSANLLKSRFRARQGGKSGTSYQRNTCP